MLFILLVSLLLLLPHFIRLLFFLFCCIFGALYFRVFAFHPLLFWSFMHILTLIGAIDLKDCKSTVRFCMCFFFLEILLFLRRARNRLSFFLSSTKVEYCVMTSTTCEIVWLYQLLTNTSISLPCLTPIYYENKSIVQIAHNFVFYKGIKHIEIVCHLTCHLLYHDTLTLLFVLSSL